MDNIQKFIGEHKRQIHCHETLSGVSDFSITLVKCKAATLDKSVKLYKIS